MFLPMGFYGNPMYIVVFVVGLVLSIGAQALVQGAYAKWRKVPNSRGVTGAQAARYLLDSNGLQNVRIEPTQGGTLSDHYDPKDKVLRLSPDIYSTASIAAVAVAAHESGHALQDQAGYGPLRLRSAIVPVAGLGSQLGLWIMIAGLFMGFQPIAILGLVLFALTFVFTVVTLPVEFNASTRALGQIEKTSLLTAQEMDGARSMLRAAALTYVAAAAASLLQVLYWGSMILGGGRRRG
ncbi:MAG: zinc metallopeptidase [Anaerolineae bacterium]